MAKLQFKVGNYQLHDQPNFNFQLNRVHNLGADLDTVKEIAAQSTDFKTYVAAMKRGEEKARAEGNMRAVAAYLRGQDFFTPVRDGKLAIYKNYKELYYKLNAGIMEENHVQKVLIPYENGFLPVFYCLHEHDTPKGTVVIHGGFDSYVEEFLKFMIYMYQNGYNAYIFEGPGQGACINEYGMPFTPEWHKPVGAVLDYFHLDDVALVGISLGAVLCKLAAAREPRIKQVLAVGAMTSYLGCVFDSMPIEYRKQVETALERHDKNTVNKLMSELADRNLTIAWMIEHGTYVFQKETPYDFLCAAAEYDIAPLADQITQDYLLVVGAHDHFVPLSATHSEIDLLTNVHSFTMRIITAEEKGDDHCNVSNRKLMLDFFINWLETSKRLRAETEEAIRLGYHK